VTSHAIPERIVAALQELGEELTAWCAEGRERDLEAHERAVLDRVRAALPRVLRAVIEEATSGLHPRLARARQACPGCGAKARPHGAARARQVETRCGTLELPRPITTAARAVGAGVCSPRRWGFPSGRG
jgi:hypothetical protein